jgi:hypothetical protein
MLGATRPSLARRMIGYARESSVARVVCSKHEPELFRNWALGPLMRSSGRAMVETEHPIKMLAPSDCFANASKRAGVLQQLVTDALMIALTVVVGRVLRQRMPQRCFSEEGHPAQALFLDRAKALIESARSG